jgi:hypothetical protein
MINKRRPKAVVVCGKLDSNPKCWKFLARIRDSIPVIWNDGCCYYTFWLNGFQGIVLQSSEFQNEDSLQMKWLQEQMEQSRMAKNRVFCFCDCDPKDLPTIVLKRLARGRVVALVGHSMGEDYKDVIEYRANEKLDDDSSVKSTESDEDDSDNAKMEILGSSTNGLRWITVEETDDKWYSTFEAVQ